MKRIVILLVAALFVNAVYSQKITVVQKNKSQGSIVIPDKPTAIETKAATVLQNYLEQMSGAKVEIKSDRESAKGAEILIGKVNRPEARAIATDKLDKDGFILKNVGNKLVIAGGTDKGVLYAVNTLVEKYLGYRKYSSAVSYIPKLSSIAFSSINDTQIPTFSFRRIEYRDANIGEFADWNRVTNGNDWGTWCHTFNQLLSPAEYGVSHPEYFSFYNGTRHAVSTSQLCLSNPEVFEIVYKNLKAKIESNPSAKYWSLSQNDNVNYCRCPECSKLDAQYAAAATSDQIYATGNTKYASTGMGSMMYFINKMSQRFPDKVLSTLAYQHTRRPPVNILPANNVNIMLCSIESSRDVPMEVGDKPFASDLAGWGKLTKDILVWDYVIQFDHLLAPFPNLRTLQPNIQFLKKNGVTALFEQGNRQMGGEFSELRAYMLTKLMWNSDANINDVMNDFLNGYYGKGGKIIREYIDLSTDKMQQSGAKLTIFGKPTQSKETFLSDSLIKVYNGIFDRAEKAVSNSPDVLMRVKTARLPVYYAMLEIAKGDKTGPRGAFTVDAKGVQTPNPQIVEILNKFVSQCIATGVTRIAEWNTVPQDYLEAYNDFLAGRPAKPPVRLH